MDHQDEYREKCRCDPRTNAELTGIVSSRLADPDDEQYWEAMRILHGRFSTEMFAQARAWSQSQNADLRRAAADLLAQAHFGDPEFEGPAGELLVQMLDRERHPETLHSLAIALGHNGHPGKNPLLVKLRTHPDDYVRYAVTYGLAGCDESAAVEALIELSRDTDTDVRDWATFALGSQTELDNEAIRQALWARVIDSDMETQGEALVGLARRKDPRVGPVLQHMLQESSVSYLVVEAAEELQEPALLDPLRKLQSRRSDREEWLDLALNRAIRACGG